MPTLSYHADEGGARRARRRALPADRDAPLRRSRWWLRSVVGTGDAGVAAVEAAFARLARGREAERSATPTSFTEFDG